VFVFKATKAKAIFNQGRLEKNKTVKIIFFFKKSLNKSGESGKCWRVFLLCASMPALCFELLAICVVGKGCDEPNQSDP
jgi:hypothetical protein